MGRKIDLSLDFKENFFELVALGLETNFGESDSFGGYYHIPKYLEDLIDDSVKQDFLEVLPLNPEDRKHEMYKAMKFSFEASHIDILYERKVISKDENSLVIPHEQFLFGFRPSEGLCIFTQKKQHKEMLCDGPIRELAKHCVLTQSLQYALVPLNEFRVWSYIPVCCSEDTCPLKTRPFNLRRDLFED
nr:hypothetical protein DSAG12_01653 [Candidatus Prometheoarchaeum syntrophicum]